jgi:hypothetical protein
MGRYRISIAGLMAVMIPVALGLAAFRSATELWVNTVFNVVIVVLLIATYKAKCSPGVTGARWTGFATFGWAHLVLGLTQTPWQLGNGFPVLGTKEVAWRLVTFWESAFQDSNRSLERYFVLQFVASILLAVLGAGIFGFFAARGMRSERAHRQTCEDSLS